MFCTNWKWIYFIISIALVRIVLQNCYWKSSIDWLRCIWKIISLCLCSCMYCAKWGVVKLSWCHLFVYINMCYSYFPWFEIFYRLLNHFAELLNQGKTVAVQSLLVELYKSHVPWQGMFVELQVDSEDTVSATTQLYVITARCYASTVYAVVLYLSVRPFVTCQYCTKRAKHRIMQTTPYDSQCTLVFWCQRSRRN